MGEQLALLVATDENLEHARRVFGVSCAVGRVPERAEPFVLPHGAQKVPGPE